MTDKSNVTTAYRSLNKLLSDDPTVKRVHYFNGQFLVADDFTLDQNYHIDMLKAHNQNIHGSGVIQGFDVTDLNGKVNVSKGIAIDDQGRQIILLEDYLTKYNASQDQYVYLCYKEETSNKSTTACENDYTRYTECPEIKIAGQERPPCPSGGSPILLAQLTTGGVPNTSVKESCKFRVNDETKTVEVTGNLTVTEALTAQTITANGDLTANGNLIGAAQSANGLDKYKIVTGKQTEAWTPSSPDGSGYFDVTIDTTIDSGTTSNFTKIPRYFITIEYILPDQVPSEEINSAMVYNATLTNFSVRYWGTDATYISINWIGIGE